MLSIEDRTDAVANTTIGIRYSFVAIILHWVIAALILTNLYLGFRMGFLKGLAQFNVFQLHKSVGITILVLSVLRLVWRLLHPPPPATLHLKPWEKIAAASVHWAFYVIMIGMPLSGWIVVSTSKLNIPTVLYRAIPWPHFPFVHDLSPGEKAAVNGASGTSHQIFAWTALILLGLHVGAVIKHHVLDRDAVLGRMLPLAQLKIFSKDP